MPNNALVSLVTVKTGPLLFEFSSFSNWVNKGRSRFQAHGVSSYDSICIDAKDRICTMGSHFQTADEDGAYPIRVYAVRGDT